MNHPNPGHWTAPTGPRHSPHRQRQHRQPPPGVWPAPSPPEAAARSQGPWFAVSLSAAGAVAVGSLLPWIEVTAPLVGQVSVAGTEGDGVLTLLVGGAAGAVTLARRKAGDILAALAFLVVLLIGVYDMTTITDSIDAINREGAHATVGMGLWVVVVATTVGFVASLVTASRR